MATGAWLLASLESRDREAAPTGGAAAAQSSHDSGMLSSTSWVMLMA